MEQKKEEEEEEPEFFGPTREFFLSFFGLFWWFPFLSLLSKRNNINKNTKRHNKKGKVPSSIERRLFGLFLLSYFSISATHSRSFVCSRQIVEEKKELSFFCLFQRRRKGREKRGTRNAKKSSSLSFSFFDRKGKNLLCKSPKKTRRRRRKKT